MRERRIVPGARGAFNLPGQFEQGGVERLFFSLSLPHRPSARQREPLRPEPCAWAQTHGGTDSPLRRRMETVESQYHSLRPPLLATRRCWRFFTADEQPSNAAFREKRFPSFHLSSASGLTTFRAKSRINRATGLSVRPLSVTTLMGGAATGNSTGNTFNRTLGGLKCRNILPSTPRYWPCATKLLVH